MISSPADREAPMRRMALRSGLAASLPAVALLAGCASLQSSENFLGVVTPYRLEVVQGNVVTKEQAALVKPGMSRSQVRDILGSPLLTDLFHADRWDYVFTIRRQGAEPQLRRIVLLFDGESLRSIDAGGELPAERDFIASIDTFKTSRQSRPLALSEEQVKALPRPPQPPASEPEASAPQRSYPPLEAPR
jgi:outer membrane protein assembly factor BamE